MASGNGKLASATTFVGFTEAKSMAAKLDKVRKDDRIKRCYRKENVTLFVTNPWKGEKPAFGYFQVQHAYLQGRVGGGFGACVALFLPATRAISLHLFHRAIMALSGFVCTNGFQRGRTGSIGAET